MADSNITFRPENLASLCIKCSQLFYGHHMKTRSWTVLFGLPAISLISPKSCRICLVIQSRHRRFVENKKRVGDIFDLREVEYYFATNIEETDLHFKLVYGERDREFIRMAMLPANTAKKLLLSQSLPFSTGSVASIDFLKSKFKECHTSHSKCSQSTGMRFGWHPRRLLEIGNGSRTVYLRDQNEIKSEPYMTLSHRWGEKKPYQLTRATEASLRAGISIECLPKTFRHAIFVANKFSVLYIWIDSLCIYQDDLKDWHREASLMCEVYSHAICNIAATAAFDGSDGLFFERDPAVECPFWVEVSWSFEENKDDNATLPLIPSGIHELVLCDQGEINLERAPLNERAWVMQERLLSTRVLHFSSTQLFWECLENFSSEVFQNVIPEMAQTAPMWAGSQQLKQSLFRTQRHNEWKEEMFDSWGNFVVNYSRCELSEESDKLVALHGIQQQVLQISGDTLIAGLWRGRLVEELCWKRSSSIWLKKITSGVCSPQTWHAPSWSWACTRRAVWPGRMPRHIKCPELQTHISIEASDINAFESGKLKHAFLTVRGKILNATFIIGSSRSSGEYSTEFICGNTSLTAPSGQRSFDLIFDNPSEDTESQLQDGLVCLKMFSCRCKYPEVDGLERHLEALVLKMSDAAKGQYERVGILSLEGHYYDFYIKNETDDEQSLLLV